jgi:hypothetical protein
MELLNAVFSNSTTKILYGGAIRGGKTAGAIGAALLLCKLYPFSRWAIVRDSLQTLKRNTIPSFNKLCPRNFIKSYNQDTQTVTTATGAQIIFFGENYADDKELDRWKGLEVNGFILEEMNELQEVSYWKAIERAGSHILPDGYDKPKPLIIGTCNPSNNWVKDLWYNRYKDGTLPKGWLYISSKITDNPFVMADQDYVNSLKDLPRYQYEVFVEGNWDIQLKTGGEFYKCFELDVHVKDNLIYDPSKPLHISWDDNVNPYLPLGIFQIHGTEAHMIDEIAGISPNNTVKAVCNEFIRKYPEHKAGLFVYGDATAKKEDTKMEKGYNFYRLIADYLKAYKPHLRVLNSNPSVVMRGNFINTVMEKGIYGLKILISEDCKYAINDFILLKEAADGTKNKQMETDPKTKVRYQKYGHFTDLFDYFYVSAFASEFTKYQTGSHGLQVTIGKNRANHSY